VGIVETTDVEENIRFKGDSSDRDEDNEDEDEEEDKEREVAFVPTNCVLFSRSIF
jgi:hypothetical protein